MNCSTNVIKHCSICGEATSRIINCGGFSILTPRACACRRKEIDEEERREEEIRRYTREKDILDKGYLNKDYARITFSKDDGRNPDMQKQMIDYCNTFDTVEQNNIGLFLYGTTGTAKTYYASCIANELRKRGKYVLIGTAPEMIRYFTQDYGKNDEAIRQIKSYSLVIIDDIGMEKPTDKDLSVLNEIVDLRYLAKKPLIVTSNLTLEEMRENTGLYGDRITSRLDEICIQIRLTGEDSRRK